MSSRLCDLKVKNLGDIVAAIPQDFSIKEKARMAYLLLAQNSFYDTKFKYLWGYDEQDYFQRSSIFAVPNIRICKQFADQYTMLLKSLGINYIEEKTFEDREFGTYHPVISFQDESGTMHKADISLDLSRVQSHSKTNHFGIGTIPEDELRQIDMKIKYISPKDLYLDDYLPDIKAQINSYDLSEPEKVQMLLGVCPRFFDIHRMGENEQYLTLNFLFRRVMEFKDCLIHRHMNYKEKTDEFYIKTSEKKPGIRLPVEKFKFYNKKTKDYEDIEKEKLEDLGVIRKEKKFDD